jgi:hypothetical protein
MIPVKRGTEYSPDRIYEDQTWLAFQYCTNYRAGRAVSRCGHWFNGMVQAPANILKVRHGEQSVLDRAYGIIGTNTNIILKQDVGDFESRE